MTLIGGLLVVLPFWVNLLLLFKAIKSALAPLQPIAKLVPQKSVHHDVVALCLLMLICFAVGWSFAQDWASASAIGWNIISSVAFRVFRLSMV